MKWQGRRRSTNVTDARGKRVAVSTAGLAAVLNFVGRRFGFKGILILVALGFIGWQVGLLDPAAILGGGQVRDVPYEATPEEQRLYEFVTVVLADTEKIWTDEFSRAGLQYSPPQLVIYSDRYSTACGMGDARMGPFYCPADQSVYIDLGFYDALENQFDAPGDFAQAYVIAHEVGHHVQNLLGISDQVAALRGRPDYNEWGDIEEALRAANQIGDDAIQARTQGKVVPHAFTHGTSEQRMRWFERGVDSGNIDDANDIFEMPYESL
jgi:predicted metalloprotease